MKTTKSFFVIISLLLFSLTVANAQIKHEITQVAGKSLKTGLWRGNEVQFLEREIAVKIDPSTTITEIEDMLKAVEGEIFTPFDKQGWGLLKLPAEKNEITAIDELMNLPFVLFAEPNMLTSIFFDPDDPYYQGTTPATYPYQWALKNTGQTPPTGTNDADIDADYAWDVSKGSSNVIIAVLDSGIPMIDGSLSHPDLNDENKIILGADYIYDGNGVMDKLGHGTHVAGIAAAESNNATGITGVALNCKILVVQVFDESGYGSHSAFYNGA